MLECKDCCIYDTEACRYGKYALEHDMSKKCDDFIVEHNKAYHQGRADAIDELKPFVHFNYKGKKFLFVCAEDFNNLSFVEQLNEQKNE